MKGFPTTLLGVFLVLGSILATGCGSGDDATTGDTMSGDTTGDTLPADATGPAPMELTVMTYNVLCSFCDNTYDPWAERLTYHQDIIKRHDPDLIGLQELTFAEEVDEYLALNAGYAAVYFISTDPDTLMPTYPDETILYRKDRFREIEQGFFWLSPTPDEPFTVGFAEGSSQFWRLVGWVLLEQISDGRRLYMVNTHFDNNFPSQELSGPLVYERLADKVAQHPVVFTGDFNTHPGEAAYANLVEGVDGHDWHFTDAWDIAAERLVVINQDPEPPYEPANRIDQILLAGGDFQCPSWRVDLTTYGARSLFPSDHYAISARIVIR